MRIFLLVIGAAVALWLSAPPANSHPVPCNLSYNDTRLNFQRRHGEVPVARGLGAEGAFILELWHNKVKDSVSVIIVYPDHQTCLLVAAENWTELEAEGEDDGSF